MLVGLGLAELAGLTQLELPDNGLRRLPERIGSLSGLTELEPRWGGLSWVTTPAGLTVYLCPRHADSCKP